MRTYLIPSLLLCFLALGSCNPGNTITKRHSEEDKSVLELINRLNKNPNDKEAATLLPEAYQAALHKRRETIILTKNSGHIGDRWMEIAKERTITLQLYEAIKASPTASRLIPNPINPSNAIASAKQRAATEYYNQGIAFMNYNNREYAQKAYSFFEKANNAVPGFKDASTQMQLAREKSLLRVLVKPVNYYRYGWNYWGFQNDWLQQQLVRDLNAGSYRNIHFYSDRDAAMQQIRTDRVVELNFTNLQLGQIHREQYSIQRSAQIQTGTTKSIPAKPVYTTVKATVFVTRHFLESNATLECRIFDWASGRNILYDRFPDRFLWKVEKASFRGDQRALQPSDWALINNRENDQPPTRNQLAERLMRNCYNLLLLRIRNGVDFD